MMTLTKTLQEKIDAILTDFGISKYVGEYDLALINRLDKAIQELREEIQQLPVLNVREKHNVDWIDRTDVLALIGKKK